jgi:hypothetical protein
MRDIDNTLNLAFQITTCTGLHFNSKGKNLPYEGRERSSKQPRGTPPPSSPSLKIFTEKTIL